MGEDFHRTKLGTTIGQGNLEIPNGLNVSEMFFADDSILISETKKVLNN